MGGSAKNHYYESENTKNPYQKNKQDWPKGYLFCHECDNEKLSKMERDFNEECFISIIKGTFKLSEKNFPIIFRFSVSIVFRVLIYITTSNKKMIQVIDDDTINCINDALDEWRSILFKNISSSEKTCLYFGILETINGKNSLRQMSANHFLFNTQDIMDLLQKGKSVSRSDLIKIFSSPKRDVILVIVGPLVIFATLNSRLNLEINDIIKWINCLKKVEIVGDSYDLIDFPNPEEDAYLYVLIKLIQ